MKRKNIILLLVVAFLGSGYSWFDEWYQQTFEQKKEPKPVAESAQKKEEKSNASSATPPKTQEKKEQSATKPASVQPKPTTKKLSEDEAEGETEVTKEEDLEELEAAITDIISTNQKVKALHQSQLSEIQRIQDQANIHRRILKDLENYQKTSRPYSSTQAEEILRQEKFRIIHDTTRKNKKYIETLPQTNPAKDIKKKYQVPKF